MVLTQIKEIKITTPTIKLEQFLKWAEVASSGGEAKNIIKDGLVKVNGIREIQRGKQIKSGDLVEIENFGIYKVIS